MSAFNLQIKFLAFTHFMVEVKTISGVKFEELKAGDG